MFDSFACLLAGLSGIHKTQAVRPQQLCQVGEQITLAVLGLILSVSFLATG